MSSTHAAHDIQKEIRVYIAVFVALGVLTIVTVGVSYLHLNLLGAIGVALTIATIKAGLVACYFMHLISEKKLIYGILLLMFSFFIGLMLLPVSQHADVIRGSQFTHYESASHNVH